MSYRGNHVTYHGGWGPQLNQQPSALQNKWQYQPLALSDPSMQSQGHLQQNSEINIIRQLQ